ncbi:hypothetical protein YC2023_017106 [Brassica napus]
MALENLPALLDPCSLIPILKEYIISLKVIVGSGERLVFKWLLLLVKSQPNNTAVSPSGTTGLIAASLKLVLARKENESDQPSKKKVTWRLFFIL